MIGGEGLRRQTLPLAVGPILVAVLLVTSVWYLGQVRARKALESEISEAVQYRAATGFVHIATLIARMKQNQSMIARDPAARAWIMGETQAPPEYDPQISANLYFMRTADGVVHNYGAPAAHALFLPEAEGHQAQTLLIHREVGAQAYLVHIEPVLDPDGRTIGSTLSALDLDHYGSLFEGLRGTTDAQRIALFYDGVPVGVPAEEQAELLALKQGLHHKEGAGIPGHESYVRYDPLPIQLQAELGLMIVSEWPRANLFLTSDHRLLWPPLVAGIVLALLLTAWMKRRVTRGVDDLHGFLERVPIQGPPPDYRDRGIPSVDRLGRTLARLVNDFHNHSSRPAENLERLEEDLAHLQEREKRMTMLVEHLPDGVIAVNKHGQITQLNQTAEQLTGWARHEAMGISVQKVLHLIHPRTRERQDNPILIAMETKDRERIDAHALMINRAGEEALIRGEAAPFLDAEGAQACVLVFREIDADQWRQDREGQGLTHKVFARMADGLAHDFNNLLSAVMGYAELMNGELDQKDGPRRETLRASLEQILVVAQRGVDLTGQLTTLTGRSGPHREGVDVHRILESSLKMVGRTLDENIKIVKRFEAEARRVEGDPSQLEHALLNLLLNAREAMPNGGTLTVGTTVVILDESFCRHRREPVKPGEYLEISIADTGVGLTESARRKLTKHNNDPLSGPPGVKGAISEHRGLLTVYSEPEYGTVYKIHLPSSAVDTETETNPAVPVRGEGLILLVEDEPVVREIALTMLQHFGYGVIEAHNGREGVEKYRQFKGEIDLVILDMEMPVMSGREAMTEILLINPEARILIASGYSLDLEGDMPQGGYQGFIQKPYLMGDFSKVISDILAHPTADEIA